MINIRVYHREDYAATVLASRLLGFVEDTVRCWILDNDPDLLARITRKESADLSLGHCSLGPLPEWLAESPANLIVEVELPATPALSERRALWTQDLHWKLRMRLGLEAASEMLHVTHAGIIFAVHLLLVTEVRECLPFRSRCNSEK